MSPYSPLKEKKIIKVFGYGVSFFFHGLIIGIVGIFLSRDLQDMKSTALVQNVEIVQINGSKEPKTKILGQNNNKIVSEINPSLRLGQEINSKLKESKIKDKNFSLKEIENKKNNSFNQEAASKEPLLQNLESKEEHENFMSLPSLSNDPKANAFQESDFYEPPALKKAPQPFYPPEALHKGIEGEVSLLLTIDQDGKVIEVSFLKKSGSPLLDKAAAQYAQKLVYKPGRKNGKTIIVAVEQTFPFRLESSQESSQEPSFSLGSNNDL